MKASHHQFAMILALSLLSAVTACQSCLIDLAGRGIWKSHAQKIQTQRNAAQHHHAASHSSPIGIDCTSFDAARGELNWRMRWTTHRLQESHTEVSPDNSQKHVWRVTSMSSEEMELRYINDDERMRGNLGQCHQTIKTIVVFNIVSPHVEQDELVYVAGSMRGDCFHSTSTCHGLRNARRGSNGVTTITKQGASLRNMRPCQLCKPTSITAAVPSRLHLVQYEGSVGRGNNQLVPTSSQLTRNGTETTSSTVYIAASLKGQCYHSHVGCKGLGDAYGVTSILLKMLILWVWGPVEYAVQQREVFHNTLIILLALQINVSQTTGIAMKNPP